MTGFAPPEDCTGAVAPSLTLGLSTMSPCPSRSRSSGRKSPSLCCRYSSPRAAPNPRPEGRRWSEPRNRRALRTRPNSRRPRPLALSKSGRPRTRRSTSTCRRKSLPRRHSRRDRRKRRPPTRRDSPNQGREGLPGRPARCPRPMRRPFSGRRGSHCPYRHKNRRRRRFPRRVRRRR